MTVLTISTQTERLILAVKSQNARRIAVTGSLSRLELEEGMSRYATSIAAQHFVRSAMQGRREVEIARPCDLLLGYGMGSAWSRGAMTEWSEFGTSGKRGDLFFAYFN